MISVLQPKWMKVKDRILDGIRSGEFVVGCRLPSEQALAREMKIAHLTVRRGLRKLVEDGVVAKRPNVGNYVNEISYKQLITPLALVMPNNMLDTSDDSAVRQLMKLLNGSSDLGSCLGTHPAPGIYLNGICRNLDPAKYTLTTMFYRRDQFWQDVGQVALAQGIKGFFLSLLADSPIKNLKRLLETGIKVVLIGVNPQYHNLGIFQVGIDCDFALVQALNKFYELGHRRIVAVRYRSNPETFEQDERNHRQSNIYQDFLRRTGLKSPDDLRFHYVPNDLVVDFSVIRAIFDFEPKPTAILVPDEFCAYVVFRECYLRKISIPQELSLAALYDNIPFSHPLPLSAPDTIRLENRAMEIAADHLVRQINGEKILEWEVVLKSEMVWRVSTAPPPTTA